MHLVKTGIASTPTPSATSSATSGTFAAAPSVPSPGLNQPMGNPWGRPPQQPGSMGLGMMPGMEGMSPEMIDQMMSSPAMEAMMNNPEVG